MVYARSRTQSIDCGEPPSDQTSTELLHSSTFDAAQRKDQSPVMHTIANVTESPNFTPDHEPEGLDVDRCNPFVKPSQTPEHAEQTVDKQPPLQEYIEQTIVKRKPIVSEPQQSFAIHGAMPSYTGLPDFSTLVPAQGHTDMAATFAPDFDINLSFGGPGHGPIDSRRSSSSSIESETWNSEEQFEPQDEEDGKRVLRGKGCDAEPKNCVPSAPNFKSPADMSEDEARV